MSSSVNFAPLGSRDAARIWRLQRRLFPRPLRDELAEVRDILQNTEEYAICNMSFGVFDNGRMVGYVFAYIESESLFHEREEEVVYLKEIGLLPGHEGKLSRIWAKLFQLWLAYSPGLALEAHAVDDLAAYWKRGVRTFRHYGVSISEKAGSADNGGPDYRLLRLDVRKETLRLLDCAASLPAPVYEHDNGVTATVITDVRQWQTIRSDWARLLEKTHDANVLQSFDYVRIWWKYFGFWNDLRIVVLRLGEDIVGIVPLMREHFKVMKRPVRKLLFITSPMEMNRPKLLFGGKHRLCAPAFLGYLHSSADEWDVLDLDEQLWSKETEEIRANLERAKYLVADSETLCPYIDIQGEWKEYFSGLSSRMRSNVRRVRRRLAEHGAVAVRQFSEWPALNEALNAHCEVESRSWKAENDLGLGSDGPLNRFYHGLAKSFGSRGCFELRTLDCDGRSIASTFGIGGLGEFHSLRIAHDRAFDRCSPGTILESYEIEELFSSEFSRYEFIGSFLTNKLRWTSTVHRTRNIHAYKRTPRLALFFWTFFVFKRKVKVLLTKIGQLERVDRLLKKWNGNPFLGVR